MVPFPSEHKAGLGKRFLARLVDGLVLFIPLMVVTVPLAGGFAIGTQNTGSKAFVAGVVGMALVYGYFVVLESQQGATVGKRALGISVQDAGGGKPSVSQAARRNAFMLLSVIPGTVGGFVSIGACIAVAITIGRDPSGRGAHDRFSDLQVVAAHD